MGTTTYNYLYAITGTSASDVWAVGTAAGTLVEHWNGTAWSIIPSPNAAGTTQDTLTAVTAFSSTDAWAVGYAYDGSGNQVTLTLHWDGSSWSVVPSPNTSAPTNVIRGVSGSGPDDVWAVGAWDYYPTAYKHGPLIEHWNGSSWTITPSPNPAPVGGGLTSVSAASPGHAVAVGSYGDFNGNTLPLIEQWTGTAWQQIAAAPILPFNDYYLFTGVSALSGTAALAVGYSTVMGLYHTFAESTSTLRIMTPGSRTSRITHASRALQPQVACAA